MQYLVQFKPREGDKPGYIEGFPSARAAKRAVERVEAFNDAHPDKPYPLTLTYLGNEDAYYKRRLMENGGC